MERFFGRATLQELLVSHAIPGLIGMAGLFFLCDLLSSGKLVQVLSPWQQTWPPVIVGGLIGALIAGPLIDSIRHRILERLVDKYRKWGRRLKAKQPGTKLHWEALQRKLSADMSATERLELYQYLRSTVYHWGEFYGNTALALAPTSFLFGLLSGVQYSAGVGIYLLLPLFGLVAAFFLFWMYLDVMADYLDILYKAFPID